MDHTAPNDNVGNVSLDAAARRRRMHRRHAKRRLTRIGVVAFAIFAAAHVLTPDRTPLAAATSAETQAGSIRRAVPKQASGTSANLPMMPTWRPAGEVLKRKPNPGMVLPFSTDPREIEHREALNRWHRIYTFSTRFRIKTDMARRVYDAAVTAGIEPELAFRLIRLESRFDPTAVSPVGAVGLSQLMLGTAREFEPNVTREDLMDPDINLRIGFRYLRALIREYKDLKIALLVYNRGPVAVQNALALGIDPANGYDNVILRGYRGRGLLD
jgi:soluble lytic murein transglycosylase-like protein